MHLYKTGIEGSYKPTLFSLWINKNSVLDADKRIKQEFGSIFFHEYIHFLQDILTPFGLRNFTALVRELSVINREIIGLEKPDFSIPFKTSNENILLEKEIFRLIWGTEHLDNKDREFVIINLYKESYTINPQLADEEFIVVDIMYRDNFEKDSFYLGAIHFLENMAYLLERKFHIEATAVPFPYTVLEKLIQWRFDDGDHSDINYIRLFENALGTYRPAKYLYEYFEYCKKTNQSICENSIYLFKKSYKLKWGNAIYIVDRFYFPNAVRARDGIDAMFNHEELIPMRKWGRLLIGNAIKLKRNNFSFVDLLVVNSDYQKVNMNLNKLIKKLGTPIMSDKNCQLFLSTPDSQPFENDMLYLLGLEAIINTLNGKTICSLLPYCSHGQGGEDITDRFCLETPWERVNKMPRCIFARLWIMWGFVQKNVQVN